jgi:small subunit ribosomal protein S20
MANHPSAEKRNRQRIRRTERNRAVKGSVRTLIKKARVAISGTGKQADVKSALADAIKAVDRAASKGIVHPKMAARTKARLSRAANKSAKPAA